MRRRGRGEAGNRSETKTLADTCSVPAGLLASGRSGASRVPRRVPLAHGARERDARGRPAGTRSAAGAGYVRTSPVLCQERGAGEAGARASTPAAPAPRQLEGPAPAPPRTLRRFNLRSRPRNAPASALLRRAAIGTAGRCARLTGSINSWARRRVSSSRPSRRLLLLSSSSRRPRAGAQSRSAPAGRLGSRS